MPWQDAVQQAPDGVRLLLEVSPGAKHAGFPAGYNEWRQRIGIRVRAQAQEGRANKEVCDAVAAFFEVARADVELVSGPSDARKTILVRDVALEAVLARLAVCL